MSGPAEPQGTREQFPVLFEHFLSKSCKISRCFLSAWSKIPVLLKTFRRAWSLVRPRRFSRFVISVRISPLHYFHVEYFIWNFLKKLNELCTLKKAKHINFIVRGYFFLHSRQKGDLSRCCSSLTLEANHSSNRGVPLFFPTDSHP